MTMDVAGARALAQRIAQGKPIDEEGAAPPPIEPPNGVEVVFVRPRVLDRRPKVWTYVRGPDGHLHRTR
jgi:hypothetical protein